MANEKKRSRPWPLAVDPFGGVSSRGLGVEFQISEGGLSLTREVRSDDWRVGYGEGWGRIDVSTTSEHLLVSGLLPMMVFIYSRETGNLESALISGVDLASLAGTKMALASGDWEEVAQMKRGGIDRLINIVMDAEEIGLQTIDVVKKEVTGRSDVGESELGEATIGVIPGTPTNTWSWNLHRLSGRVGLAVFPDRVVYYYEKDGDDPIRLNVMEVPRRAAGLVFLDESVKRGMPKEAEVMDFIQGVYVPLL